MLPGHAGGGWRLRAEAGIVAGTTDRFTDRPALTRRHPGQVVEAEQVHGASIASVPSPAALRGPVAGCDALMTSQPGAMLIIRTADCLPVFFTDAARGAVALAHVGWRGLAAQLPMRVVAAMAHVYRSPASELRVAIGPAIRACCYEVGPEFAQPFGPWLRTDGARRRCDLIGAVIDQLRRCGVRPGRVADSGLCTACDTARWFSLRREGPSTGRLLSYLMLPPWRDA